MNITTNMTKARELHKDKVRVARKPLLEALDVEFQRALETNSNTTSIVEKKQKLRDAPGAAAIANASNETELKAAWDTSILGSTPYRS